MDAAGNYIVCDWGNYRLMKRVLGAAEGEVAAGGKGAGPGKHKLHGPYGVAVDAAGK